jgi:hypothetical protein
MDDPARVARLLLESASTLANTTNARAIVVAADALPELEGVPPRTVLVSRDEEPVPEFEKLFESAHATITVPRVELDRLGQVKLAAIIAISHRIIDLNDDVIFLSGPYKSLIDTLVVMSIGAEYELFDTTDQPELGEHIKRAVFHRVLALALQIGQHGREGKKIGALFVVGDIEHVLEQSKQMILNPFKGYDPRELHQVDLVHRQPVGRRRPRLEGG